MVRAKERKLIVLERQDGVGINRLRLTARARTLLVDCGIAHVDEIFVPRLAVSPKDLAHTLWINDLCVAANQLVPPPNLALPAWALQRRLQLAPPAIPDLLAVWKKTTTRCGLALGSEVDLGGEGASHDARPSLVVAPRSVIFNWRNEAERFTPALRVLEHASADRSRDAEVFTDYDIILTTYGTLRRDAALLASIEFDTVVLDEAQAIKNPSSQSAKAARLLRSRQRLALTGTPVENHIGDLWSIFEFLNPGMLGGSAKRIPSWLKIAGTRGDEGMAARALVGRALRPFILRWTKGEVARELPDRVEQTILCELDTAQRAIYDDLRNHYRASLLGHVAAEGMNKWRMHVLEALLRLRQAACHPGLVNARYREASSAKLDTLLSELSVLLDENHKVLVFSQFTSFLALVKAQLDERGVVYEYLDGKTKNRAERVQRFQEDPTVSLFLISLKAGGLGLNLTAAEYVFLLDPWCNPAVETQAIDRSHRIGQTRIVVAYRLVARDTIEEKILQLQDDKRALASAILTEDNSVLRQLSAEDLDLLLS